MDSASPTGRYPSPYHDERIRRNVACTNCRNSKVGVSLGFIFAIYLAFCFDLISISQ